MPILIVPPLVVAAVVPDDALAATVVPAALLPAGRGVTAALDALDDTAAAPVVGAAVAEAVVGLADVAVAALPPPHPARTKPTSMSVTSGKNERRTTSSSLFRFLRILPPLREKGSRIPNACCMERPKAGVHGSIRGAECAVE
jgi:hypothetical protein